MSAQDALWPWGLATGPRSTTTPHAPARAALGRLEVDGVVVDPEDWRDAHEMRLVEIMGLGGYLAQPIDFGWWGPD